MTNATRTSITIPSFSSAAQAASETAILQRYRYRADVIAERVAHQQHRELLLEDIPALTGGA